MLKKFLSKLGVGSAKVNLVLHNSHVRLGEKIEGEFLVEGGVVEQHINQLDVELHLTVGVHGQEHRQTVAIIPVSPSFTVHAGEKKVLPFSYVLPMNLPITRSGIYYTFVTRLDIVEGVDAFDRDVIHVLPPLPLEKVFHALNKLGFREKATSGKLTAHGQEFEFFPTEQFRETIQEVELLALLEESGVRLQIEVDVFAGFLGLGERELKREIFFSYDEVNDVEGLAQKLYVLFKEMIEHPGVYVGSPYMHHHSPHVYYPDSHHPHRHGHGMMGTIGGFAAGMLAGMVAEELIEDVVEEAFDVEEDVEGFFDDIFDGDDDIL